MRHASLTPRSRFALALVCLLVASGARTGRERKPEAWLIGALRALSSGGTVAAHDAYIAWPAAAGMLRSFCTDDSGVIYITRDGRRPLVRGGTCVDRRCTAGSAHACPN